MFKNPVFYAAIVIHWLVAFPGFVTISGVSGIVNVMSLFVPAAACFHILGSEEDIIIAQFHQGSLDYKM